MPNAIVVLNVAEFEQLLDEWQPRRRINEVHIHCTDHPRHSEFRGLASIEAMRRYHMSIGMADIAQHFTIDPQGLIWSGRPLDAIPASVRGHNGTAKVGPFMIEMVGLFEKNIDRFEGNQKDSVYAVVRAVLAKFELDESAVKFHREFPKTGKTCPGMDLDGDTFRSEVGALLKSNHLSSFEVAVPRHFERPTLERGAATDMPLRAEPDYMEVPEDADALAEQRVLAKWIEREAIENAADEGARGIKEEFRDLLGHVINTSQGILSGKGALQNTTDDLDTLIRDHLSPQFATGKFQHIVFYAHGGLVGEKAALCYAKMMLPWWKSYGVYPIFFIWESSLFQTVWQKPRGMRTTRGFGDFWDSGVEATTQLMARGVWSRMKANARRCSSPTTDFGKPGGLFEFAQRLIPWLDKFKEDNKNKKITLHAIGHSTGPILQARFMPLLIDAGHPFDTLSYLAPAIRTDDYQRDVAPLLGKGIKRLRVFTMSDSAEQDDDVVKIYRKSLLYYVRNACEDKTDGRIFGLQKDLLADAALSAEFKLQGKGELCAPAGYKIGDRIAIEFSQHTDDQPGNPRTEATTHGGFDNDRATMSSVLANMLGKPDLVGTIGDRFPTDKEFDRCRQLDAGTRALWVEEEGEVETACPCCRCAEGSKPTEFDREDDDVNDEGAPAIDADSDADSATTAVGDRGKPRRIAVCVGIDTYPGMPLDGCVNDSKTWAKLLKKVGFEVNSLHNKQATRSKLIAALKGLIETSRSGDQLVFQYAGHGSQVPDLSRDEIDRLDEALVPIDYEAGELLIDDDLYEVCSALRKRPGVTLTFLMDCCNSGSNTRAAPPQKIAANQKIRFMKMPAKALENYQRLRTEAARGAKKLPPVSERDPLPGVVSFAACQDHEFAFETDGQGDFTLRASSVFDSVIERGGSNQQFINAVVRKFGPNRKQNPLMQDPAAGLNKQKFLGGR